MGFGLRDGKDAGAGAGVITVALVGILEGVAVSFLDGFICVCV